MQAVRDALKKLEKTVRPRSVRKVFPVRVENDVICLDGAALTKSRDLSANLDGCTEAVLFACTLGAEADRLIRRSAVRSMADAAVYQAACTALVEALADRVNAAIEAEGAQRGMTARPRYSPGYGDCALDVQRDFFRLLELPKKLGLSLTPALLMVPEKTVTAFVGLMPAKDGGEEAEQAPKAEDGGEAAEHPAERTSAEGGRE
ncbi:MAG: Vitamin B12 dependent methionine synthase activation subunit [Lachnospiraceae bacterium]|nr:Vitamin B12 dependent methionine synthase activation subunit [Lachnospiraceae bacterium]